MRLLARRRKAAVPLPDPGPWSAPGPQADQLDQPQLAVATVPELAMLGPGLEFTSRGRFRCGVAPEEADVLLVKPSAPGTLRELRERLAPSVDLVVVDRREASTPQLVADMLDGGATAVVTGASSAVLVAHLDAVARRRQRQRRRNRIQAFSSSSLAHS